MATQAETWESFVHGAVTSAPDDPHVRLLRDRLRAGARVVRVHLVDGAAPEYLVLLERLRELSEQRVPHSAAFTRWSLAEGVKMADEEEVGRFRLLLGEGFEPIELEAGEDRFKAVLLERIRSLAPPHAAAVAAKVTAYAAQEGRSMGRALRDLDGVLRARCSELVGALQYGEADAARILDRALAAWISTRSNFKPARG
jgi:hypothetical protein